MIKLFRLNQPFIAYIIFVVTGLLMIPFFSNGILLNFDFPPFDSLFSGSEMVNYFIVYLLININALLVNWLVVKYLKSVKKNYLPAFFYTLSTCAVAYFFGISKVILAVPGVLFSLNYLLQIAHQKNVLNLCFKSGFWLSIASLFEFSLILLFPFYLFAIILSRSASIKEWLVLLIGGVIPYLFLGSYVYVNEINSIEIFSYYGIYEIFNLAEQSVFLAIFVVVFLVGMIIGWYAFYVDYNKSVRLLKISKKTFIIISIGLMIISVYSFSKSSSSIMMLLILPFSIMLPTIINMLRKEKYLVLSMNIVVYVTIITVILDYFKDLL